VTNASPFSFFRVINQGKQVLASSKLEGGTSCLVQFDIKSHRQSQKLLLGDRQSERGRAVGLSLSRGAVWFYVSNTIARAQISELFSNEISLSFPIDRLKGKLGSGLLDIFAADGTNCLIAFNQKNGKISIDCVEGNSNE